MAKIDYNALAKDIVNHVGGTENVVSVTHCMTRIRFILKEDAKADEKAIKSLNGVLGVVISGGQFQIVMGPNLAPAYKALTENYSFHTVAEEEKEKLEMSDAETSKSVKTTLKNAGKGLVNYVSSSVTPMIPVLVAGGMLKVVILLVALAFPSVKDTSTYALMQILSDSPFYFMPILIAYGASKRLNCTPAYAMIVAATLLAPNFTAMVAAGDPVTMFGMPVRLVSYSSTLVPALLATFAVAKLEQFFNKVIPGIFKSILVGFLTIGTAMTLTFLVLGPAGVYIGDYVVGFFVWLQSVIGPFALAFLAAALPFMVMTGMHNLLGPFLVQSLSTYGYDALFRPSFILHNMAEGGACLGVALRTKNKDLRGQAISAAVGCILAGVTEPAIYGVNLRLKRPLFGVVAGGFVGGIVASILGARAYMMGYSTILGVAIYGDTVGAILIAIAVDILVSATVTFVIGFEDVK